ncbi:MAG: family 78 glycoside hydrolase catalytic domain [Lachnospiraceae bacterium]
MLYVKNVRLNYETELMGVDEIPQVSWELVTKERNTVQKWFQIEISTKQDFSKCEFQSGTVVSSASTHFYPEGLELEPFTYYYVRVKAASETKESTWSEAAVFLTGKMGFPKKELDFITAERIEDKESEEGTCLRRSFVLKKPVKQAIAAVTAQGLYRFYLNGSEIGSDFLTPGWTSYHKHLLYQVYDVTNELRQGKNMAGAMLGAGWYKGRMGFMNELNNYGDRTSFFCHIEVTYEDETKEILETDQHWTGFCSPIVFSDIYDGEIYDARREIPDCFYPDGTEEIAADLIKETDIIKVDSSILTVQGAAKIKEHEMFPGNHIFTTPQGDTVIDFMQNMSGRLHLHAFGKKGDRVHVQCFETLDADGNVYLDNLRSAKQSVTYIFGEQSEVEYAPFFTFMGFRYIVVREFPGEINENSFYVRAIYSDMKETGYFQSSNPLLNQLHHNVQWGLKSNFVDVPTDCPQRDERCGWTGDAQIFCRAASYLMDTYTFYDKWLTDVAADTPEDGSIPHIVPDILTGKNEDNWLCKEGSTGAAAWADVIIINPWTMYLMHGDTRILEKYFTNMKRWIDFMTSHAKDNIWNFGVQFGDWVALDAEEGSYFGATPIELTNTVYYAYSCSLFVKICRILGKDEIAAEYEELNHKIRKTYAEKYFDASGHLTAQTQTAQIVTLYFELAPEEYRPKVAADLLRLLEEQNGHLVTGFIGTPYFCHALSGSDCLEEAYSLLSKEDYPSWLYQVKKGATTIWEHWDGIKPDGTMWSPNMNSFNHYAYGAVMDWVYRVAAGIEADETDPGFHHILFSPRPGGSLTQIHAAYDSMYGTIVSEWIREKDERGEAISLHFEIPPNTYATIKLTDVKELLHSDTLNFLQVDPKTFICETGSGSYQLKYVKLQ